MDMISKISGYFYGDKTSEDDESDDTDIANGLCFFEKIVPVEVLCSILKHLDEDSLISCRSVCKLWKETVDDVVWEEKLHCSKILLGSRSVTQIPWWVAYWVSKKRIFNENLIRNNCGEEEFDHWVIRENNGNQWIVESSPAGTTGPFPDCEETRGKKSCFVTSFSWCSKDQYIELAKFGLSNKIMDEIQPDFEISEWISSRFDCGGEYKLYCGLFDSSHKPIDKVKPVITEKRLESGDLWMKVTGTLSGPYPPGGRYILFHHKGKDTQFWRGHYGIKITGSVVKPIFPKERYLNNHIFNLD